MGMNQACYLPDPIDKIFGTIENYIVRFNATTGAKEAHGKIAAPLYGPCTCCAGNGVVYVGLIHDYSWCSDYDPGVANKFIWTVDPDTLVATDAFALNAFFEDYWSTASDGYAHEGVGHMKVYGDYLYFEGARGGGSTPGRVKLTDPTDNTLDDFGDPWGDSGFRPESVEVANFDGNDNMFHIDMGGQAFDSRIITPGPLDPTVSPWDLSITDYEVTPDFPAALVFNPTDTSVYIVCGNGNLHKRDAITGGAIDVFNLEIVYADVKPFRITLSPLDGKLYIPCQHKNAVIVWNPSTDTGVAVEGFNSPIDIVFTDAKAFAVQSGVTPLKEIEL